MESAVRRLRVRGPVLLLSLVALIIGYPQLDGRVPPVWLAAVVAAVLCAALYHIGTDRKHLVRGAVLAVPAIASGFVVVHPLGSVVSNGFQIAFLLYVVGNLFAFLLRRSPVDIDKLCGAGSLYLLLGLSWTVAYKIVELRHPGSFSLPGGEAPAYGDLLYFSYVTMTTLGYGDVTPVSSYARSLAVLEALSGTFFVAVLVARLVSLYGAERQRA